MQDMTVIRNWQLDQLRKVIGVMRYLVGSTTPEEARTFRDYDSEGHAGWTVLDVLCHMRDFEGVFMARANMTVEQDFPPLPFPNPEALAEQERYHAQDLAAVLAEWVEKREIYVAYLEARPDSDWQRAADHPTRGRFTLDDQLLLAVWHDMNHLEQVARILRERRA